VDRVINIKNKPRKITWGITLLIPRWRFLVKKREIHSNWHSKTPFAKERWYRYKLLRNYIGEDEKSKLAVVFSLYIAAFFTFK
jgi:hypothetical protein